MREDRIYANLLYITASTRLMFPVNRSFRAYTGLGLGTIEIGVVVAF